MMSEIVSLILLLLVCLEFNLVECVNKKSSYIVQQNVKMNDASLYHTQLTTLSFRACAAECSKADQCGTASFEMTSQICYMAAEDTTHDTEREYFFVTNADWRTVSKIMFPVILLYGPGGHYTLYSLEEATACCAEEGYEIASPDDLLQARAMGFAVCSCSWLSDGSNGLVLQEANNDCISHYTDEIITCNWSYADVWCKI